MINPDRVATALVVANPVAGGRGPRRGLLTAIGTLARHGWTVRLRETEGPDHAEALAREAAGAGIDVVVVAGGDGTVNLVANGLVGTATALAVMPAGTGNVLAAQLGLIGTPTALARADLPAAAELLCRGRVHVVDTGFARARSGPGRHFVLWDGVGLDAAVARKLEGESRDLKQTFGPAAFGALGIREALAATGTLTTIRSGTHRIRDRLLLGLACNIQLYGGAVRLAPDAVMDDGRLDVELFLGGSAREKARHAVSILTGHRVEARRFSDRAQHVRFVTSEPAPVHIDAEPFGTTPITFEVRPASLRLLVPPSAPDRLFHNAGVDGP